VHLFSAISEQTHKPTISTLYVRSFKRASALKDQINRSIDMHTELKKYNTVEEIVSWKGLTLSYPRGGRKFQIRRYYDSALDDWRQRKQAKKCTHSETNLSRSPKFKLWPVRMSLVTSELSGANDLCVGGLSGGCPAGRWRHHGGFPHVIRDWLVTSMVTMVNTVANAPMEK
jgi:hypothetical protein